MSDNIDTDRSLPVDVLLTVALAGAMNERYTAMIEFLNEEIRVLRELIDRKWKRARKRGPLTRETRTQKGATASVLQD